MSALRVPLLCAFAGGCLSAVVVLGVWRAENLAAIPAQQQLARSNELLAAALSARNAEQRREVADNAAPAARIEPDHESAKTEPPASKDAEPAPAGSAVADVLTDLEAAYRKRLIAPAPAEAPPPAPASEPPPSAPPDAPREIPAPAVVVAAAPPAPIPVAVAPVAPVAPLTPAPDVAPPAPVAAAVAPPTMVAQNDAPPSVVHYGDVNQNTYITNVRQGDTYVTQQQIAMLQYIQLLGMSSGVGMAQPAHNRAGRGVGARGAAQVAPQYKQFPSTLTNPDNPWGFTFAPPNLVH
jgi:hypothetical protein